MTKTKPSHHRPSGSDNKDKPAWPTTSEGASLATAVRASTLTPLIQGTLIREIVAHEISRGACTKTFSRKVRKQLRASA